MLPRIMEPMTPTQAQVNFAGSVRIEKYDLCYSTGTGVMPFSQQADAGELIRNQRLAAHNFAGISEKFSPVDVIVADPNFLIGTDIGMAEYDCESATFEVGDLVGPCENAGGTALEDQKVRKVDYLELAIGQVVWRHASATTRVRFRLLSRLLWHAISNPTLVGPAPLVIVLAGDLVLDNSYPSLLKIDPGGAARNVDLPAVASNKNRWLRIVNTADAAENLTVRLAGAGATVIVINQNESSLLFCDGATWLPGNMAQT